MRLIEKQTDASKITTSDQADIPVLSHSVDFIPERSLRSRSLNNLSSRLSFGWQRAEVVSAFFNGSFLLALGVSILLQSIDRFVSPVGEFDGGALQSSVRKVSLSSLALTLSREQRLRIHFWSSSWAR